MLSLRAVLIDCGIGILKRTLYLEMDLDKSALVRIEQALVDAVTAELVLAGYEPVEDYTPGQES